MPPGARRPGRGRLEAAHQSTGVPTGLLTCEEETAMIEPTDITFEIEDIDVPDTLVLTATPQVVTFAVQIRQKGPTVTGHLTAPDGSPAGPELAFGSDDGRKWTAKRTFSSQDPPGAWALHLRIEEFEDAEEFDVILDEFDGAVSIQAAVSDNDLGPTGKTKMTGAVHVEGRSVHGQLISVVFETPNKVTRYEIARTVTDGEGRFRTDIVLDQSGSVWAELRIAAEPPAGATSDLIPITVQPGPPAPATVVYNNPATNSYGKLVHTARITIGDRNAADDISIRRHKSTKSPGNTVEGTPTGPQGGSPSGGDGDGIYVVWTSRKKGYWWRVKYHGTPKGKSAWRQGPTS
ncbi:hypothetical protein [Nonomuraea sp. GTA35]|uniref:hypothetical protein n=1 Tax=Nonomuraea sp. GTA35 TaxID=1676746 RepID=UPI0035C131A5